MSYRRASYGPVRYRRPVRRMGRSRMPSRGYRRAVVPRARVLARYPAGLVGGRGATELKSVDTAAVYDIGLGQAGTIQLVLPPPKTGASFYNRVGSRTRAKSLEIRGLIQPTYINTVALRMQYVRIIVLYDRQANGAPPSVADVITDYDTDGNAITGSVLSGLNMNNRDRFLVLRDRKLILPSIGVSGVVDSSAHFYPDPNAPGTVIYNEFIKLKGLETHYKASNGTIGDISTGSFVILAQQQLPAPAGETSPAWSFVWRARFKFFD